MKNLKIIMACGFCFLLGASVPIKLIHAQADKLPETYYMLSFMKTRPGQNAFKMERELWKPIQRERVDKGDTDSWTVIEPMFSGPHLYDYMTVETASSLDKLTHIDYGPAMTKAWGTVEKIRSNAARTDSARDLLGSEIWVSVDGVSKQVK